MTVVAVLFPLEDLSGLGRVTLGETFQQVMLKIVSPALIVMLVLQTIGG